MPLLAVAAIDRWPQERDAHCQGDNEPEYEEDCHGPLLLIQVAANGRPRGLDPDGLARAFDPRAIFVR